MGQQVYFAAEGVYCINKNYCYFKTGRDVSWESKL